MGRVTDGSSHIYGTGRDQIDIAKQNRLNNPNGSHTLLGILLSQGCPQIITGVCGVIAESHSGKTNQSDSSQTDVVQGTLDIYNSTEGKAVMEAMKKKDTSKIKTALQDFYKKNNTYKPFEAAAKACGLTK